MRPTLAKIVPYLVDAYRIVPYFIRVSTEATMRSTEIKIRLSGTETAIIEAAAAVSHSTERGANVARMVREAAYDRAVNTLWADLESLLDAMRERCDILPQWDDLPTYGGEAPENTMEVWSWDAGRLIVGTCADDVEIIPRGEWS